MNKVAASSRECSGLIVFARRESTTILVNVNADAGGGDGGSSAAADAKKVVLGNELLCLIAAQPPDQSIQKAAARLGQSNAPSHCTLQPLAVNMNLGRDCGWLMCRPSAFIHVTLN